MDIRRNTHSTKADLSLLIECLKFQMKRPESQKQALLAIYSICQNREDNVDLFREMGGVAFVYSLSKSTIVHPDVKETSLFTLGTLAEANVYCKTFLCRKDTFSHLANLLQMPDSSVTQQRVSVYLLSVLVANNKIGQTFAQNTGCLDILLELFRTSFPFSTCDANLMPLNVSQMYQLWTSVANALCGCVNNPQNEDAQRICVAAFPLVKSWLRQNLLPRPEMFKPLCFFIAMSVGNNSFTQESFSASGCLETLVRKLVSLAADAERSPLCCQISVFITKTLSSCLTDNVVLVRAVAQFGLVPRLVTLLSSTHLDPQDRVPVLLTLGHCTEACDDHQLQLVQCGGLSTIISLLTECPGEELRKAATFILQTCKQATLSMGGPGPAGPGPGEDYDDPGDVIDMDAYWRAADHLLARIHRLERPQRQEEEPALALATPPAARTRGPEETQGERPGEEESRREFTPLARPRTSAPGGEGCAGRAGGLRFPWGDSSTWLVLPQRDDAVGVGGEGGEGRTTRVGGGRGATHAVQVRQVRRRIFNGHHAEEETDLPRGADQQDGAQEKVQALPQNNPRTLSHVNTRHSQPDPQPHHHQPHLPEGQDRRSNEAPPPARSDCATLGQALSGAVGPEMQCLACSGTGTVVFPPDTAGPGGAREPRTDGQVFIPPAPVKQSTGKHRKWISDDDALSLCSELLDNELRQLTRDPQNEAQRAAGPLGERCAGCVLPFGAVTSRTFWALQGACRHRCDMHRVLGEASDAFRARHALRRRRTQGGMPRRRPTRGSASREEAQQRPPRGGGRRERSPEDGGPANRPDKKAASTWRQRNDFSCEEVECLLDGVEKFGFSWNAILWSYPFKRGRTDVNLAKKYRQLMGTPT